MKSACITQPRVLGVYKHLKPGVNCISTPRGGGTPSPSLSPSRPIQSNPLGKNLSASRFQFRSLFGSVQLFSCAANFREIGCCFGYVLSLRFARVNSSLSLSLPTLFLPPTICGKILPKQGYSNNSKNKYRRRGAAAYRTTKRENRERENRNGLNANGMQSV